VAVIGVGAGLTALRDSVNSELNDVGKALGSIDQSFWFSPVVGHSAWTAGSAYFDRADYCDGPQVVAEPITVHALPHERPVVCADVFGHPAAPPVQKVPHAPHPRPDSLPGRGAAVVPPHEYGPPPHAVRGAIPAPVGPIAHPSKGVFIGEPGPPYVLGSPALVPAPSPLWGEVAPVNVMVNPWAGGPYMVDVPEGFFNHPGLYGGAAPHYRVFVHGRGGHPADYGYAYGPAHPPVAKDRPATWDTIDLGFTKVGDEELKHVEKFATAKCLHVLGSNVTDKGLIYICDLPELESLHLVGTQVTDAGIKQLTSLKKLRFLHLVGTKITDSGLKYLSGMKNLELLDVRGTEVTDAGLAELSKALPTLRIVR
jgi:hypothetical protein